MSNYELILGDCLEVMRGMEAGSVDCIVTDPPYPDYYTELYQYDRKPILAMGQFTWGR